MNRTLQSRNRSAERRGAMMILVAVLMIGFVITVAFSIDIAQMHLARTELRSATDAAAKAASETLARTQDVNQAIARGQQIARENTVVGKPLEISGSDFRFGRSEVNRSGKFLFDTSGRPRNSVQVVGSRTQGSPSGVVPLFFGNVFGVDFFEARASSTATYLERDIVLVLDRSGSMAGSNISSLISAVGTFVDTLRETPVAEKVGLSSYATSATADVALTEDLSSISSATARMPIFGFTNITSGMVAGEQIMLSGRSSEFVERTMIVMTDGGHNVGPEPSTVSPRLAAAGIQVHTITFGAGADQARMREVARAGRGRHFHAVSGPELVAIYREIALTLSTLITE